MENKVCMENLESLKDALKTRYEAVLQSSSDSQFYLNIHAYIDLIRKTLFLSKIMGDSENQYRKQHMAIWPDKSKTDKEADEREERTIRLERFNLFTAHFSWLEVRIYDPIEDYKNTDAPDDEQDPVALLMIKGIKNIKTKKWSDKTLKMYNRWFEGKRERYENDLRQFHADFLTAISQAPKLEEKNETSFDVENSMLKINGKNVKITLKNDPPNSHYVLEYIFDKGIKEKAYYTDILEEKFFNEKMDHMSMYRACNDIQDKVRKQAGIENFLEIKSGNTGWVRINPIYA
jgi:hypothetical protein